jgi:hypothetical protein
MHLLGPPRSVNDPPLVSAAGRAGMTTLTESMRGRAGRISLRAAL